MDLVATIILNWNGGTDTIDCLKTVIDMESCAHIIVWDNCSTDNSVAEIKQWLSERSVSWREIQEEEIVQLRHSEGKVSLIVAKDNYGFAKGNNLVLNQIVTAKLYDYVWLLNNDATATPDSLNEMIRKMKEDKKNAFVGSVTLDGNNKDLVQCCGVRYFKYWGVSKLQYKNCRWSEIDRNEVAENKTDYQNGASLLIKISALREIGLMDERFFLYSEEQDWQYTAAEFGYKNVLAIDSVIFHKGSVSTEGKKHLFYYYYSRSAILFSRKHYSALVSSIATILLTGISIVRTRMNIKSLKWAIKGISEGWSKSK
ncbi:glycosyltransferase family 2 protein [Taibaiella soli]|uniref:Glycosyltransferase 2-like domain-containing protein n=1 Tax=Taibaiella soli TaxID=1649169 RepID=A0A2W2BFZ6_9BACT|nr:glycosyltransferase family 2 protein [Taibaiella soli]PZF72396.1 hypothetical protein DN068_13665 [Taibaiella soli]